VAGPSKDHSCDSYTLASKAAHMPQNIDMCCRKYQWCSYWKGNHNAFKNANVSIKKVPYGQLYYQNQLYQWELSIRLKSKIKIFDILHMYLFTHTADIICTFHNPTYSFSEMPWAYWVIIRSHKGYTNYLVPMPDMFLKYNRILFIIMGNYIIVNKSYISK